MKSIPFVDTDWTGYDHATIRSMILQEYEEQQCKDEGCQWTLNVYCKNCGEQLNNNLELNRILSLLEKLTKASE